MRLIEGVVVSLFLTGGSAVAATRYVTPSGTGDCSSWSNSCSLQSALTNPGLMDDDQVWVMEGTYQTTITLVPGVKIIGGFAGGETSASQSNPATRPTVIDGNGSAPVVSSISDGPGTQLRGFRITNGNCQQSLTDTQGIAGGGAYVSNSGASFVQCTFDHNTALYRGAAVFIDGSSNPWFINCVFEENGTGSDGPSPDSNAKPWAGGAVFVNSGSPKFMNCVFHKNKGLDGAGLFNHNGTPELVNCTLVKNRAANGYGGALHDQWGRAVVRNCILWNNAAIKGGNQIFAAPSWEYGVTFSNVQGGWPGTTNMNVDPEFLNETTGDFRLGTTSPCADAGRHTNPNLPFDQGDLNWNSNTGEVTPLDMAMLPRRFNLKVDLGAFERQTAPPVGGGVEGPG